MINLIGTYECKADAKGRVMLPSFLKKQLVDVLHEGFVIKRSVFQKCLEIYPMSAWNEEMQKINKLNRYKKKNSDFIRLFMSGVKIVEPDASGRLLLPKDLCVFAGVSKQIVLSSSINIIEVWDKDKYEKAVEEAIPDYADLAEEVMGEFDADELS